MAYGKRELEKRAGITMCFIFLPKIFEYQAFAIVDLKPDSTLQTKQL